MEGKVENLSHRPDVVDVVAGRYNMANCKEGTKEGDMRQGNSVGRVSDAKRDHIAS